MEGGYREAQHSKGAECTGRKPYIPNIENIVDRFEPVVLGSGDGIFTEIVCGLQDAGCNVTLFDAGCAQISHHLRHAVHGGQASDERIQTLFPHRRANCSSRITSRNKYRQGAGYVQW